MVELTFDEELAMLEAIQKKVKTRLDELKGAAKDELMEAYEESGIDRRSIKANGSPIGKVSIRFTKAKPTINPARKAQALEALAAMGLTEVVPVKGWEKRFTHCGDIVLDAESGELAEWALWEIEKPYCAMVTGCKPEDVIDAMSTKLQGENIIGLLGE